MKTSIRRKILSTIRKVWKSHRLLCVLGMYLLVVITFALVNWVMFQKNSTAYLISEQLNKHVERYDFLNPEIDLAAYHRNAKDSLPIAISEFSYLIKPEFERLEMINDSLIIKESSLRRDCIKLDSLNTIATENREETIKTLKGNYLFELQSRIDSLQSYMDGKDSTEMIVQGKYVEMAGLQYEYAKKNAMVQSYIIKHYGGLIPGELSLQISELYGYYVKQMCEIVYWESARREVSSKIREATLAFHHNRLNSVSFCDFVYYSICVSTTVSFGDIAPNNGSTRFVAILELLICLILVGVIAHGVIAVISNDNKDK